MKNERRNDKEHQRQRLQDYRQAQQVIHELHPLMENPNSSNITVGQIVSLAAGNGFLLPRQRQPPVAHAIA